ncbi:MAG: Mur ligase family protein, partial [Candidatus Thermoplasmatota archaeon]|nr:Mur ligase family protein [Candidatus Thermoplasmatota archaeon]
SKGNGTTVATVGAALTAVGLQHIAFPSHHLFRVEQGVRHNATPIDSATFDEALARVHSMATTTGIGLTFFEVTLLVALVVAADRQPDVVLLETGLGGRLDATRTVPADVAVITSLSLEHIDVLGDTLEAIAGEKAAIARPGKPLIVRAVHDPAARARIESVAKNAGHLTIEGTQGPASLHWVEVPNGATYFDEANLLAAATWKHLTCAENHALSEIRGLRWPGRMQEIHSQGSGNIWLLEGAHNPSGMEVSCRELMDDDRWTQPWVLLLGSTPQADMEAMLSPLVDLCKQHPPAAVVLTEPQFGRYPGVPCPALEAALADQSVEVTVSFPQPDDAVAWIEAGAPGVGATHNVLCIGSLYLQGNVLQALGADDDEALAIVAKD